MDWWAVSENLRKSYKDGEREEPPTRKKKLEEKGRRRGKKNCGSTAYIECDINQPLDYATLIYRRRWSRSLDVSLFLSLGHVRLCSARKSRAHAFARVNIGWYTRRAVHTGAQAIRVRTANRRRNIVANKRRLLTRANQRRLLRVCSGSPVVIWILASASRKQPCNGKVAGGLTNEMNIIANKLICATSILSKMTFNPRETWILRFFFFSLFQSFTRWEEITWRCFVSNVASRFCESQFLSRFGHSSDVSARFDFTQKFAAVSCHTLRVCLINHVPKRLRKVSGIFDF